MLFRDDQAGAGEDTRTEPHLCPLLLSCTKGERTGAVTGSVDPGTLEGQETLKAPGSGDQGKLQGRGAYLAALGRGKGSSFKVRQSGVSTPTMPLHSCVTSDKLLKLSVPEFYHLKYQGHGHYPNKLP